MEMKVYDKHKILTPTEYRRLVLQGGYNEEEALALFRGNFGIEGGAVPRIAGGRGAPPAGYNEAGDAFQFTVDGVALGDLWDEFRETIRIHNEYRQDWIGWLSGPETNWVSPFWNGLPDGNEFEEATEYGEPVGIRTPTPKLRGFPMRYYDLAIRYTWRFMAEADSEQIRSLNNSALEKDLRLQYQIVMQSLFSNVNGSVQLESSLNTNGDIKPGGLIPVHRLYNADGEVPNRWKNYAHDGTHTHYLTSGGATVTPANLEAMEDHLVHHGHLQDGRTFILLVNRQQSKTIQGFRQGVNGATWDFIPSKQWAFRDNLVGEQPAEEWAGSYGKWLIKEEDSTPSGYMIGFATNGRDLDTNIVGVREHWNPSVKGLQLLPGRDTYPLLGSFYQHALGAGVRDRGGAIIMQITAGAYVIPTFI